MLRTWIWWYPFTSCQNDVTIGGTFVHNKCHDFHKCFCGIHVVSSFSHWESSSYRLVAIKADSTSLACETWIIIDSDSKKRTRTVNKERIRPYRIEYIPMWVDQIRFHCTNVPGPCKIRYEKCICKCLYIPFARLMSWAKLSRWKTRFLTDTSVVFLSRNPTK